MGDTMIDQMQSKRSWKVKALAQIESRTFFVFFTDPIRKYFSNPFCIKPKNREQISTNTFLGQIP